ncbi:MAG TPA: hypothetical protein DCE42_11410, partial [Myxococcales bacterium]|nr:hypothetical protein [Myxococcales bacterium]
STNRSKEGQSHPLPQPEPLAVELPEDDEALKELAVQIGLATDDLLPPKDALFPEIPIFGQITALEFVVLALQIEPTPLKPGQALIKQGSTDKSVYLLSHGNVQVKKRQSSGEDILLTEVRAPALLGEMSLMTGVPRRASVEAVSHSMAWKLDTNMLQRLAETHSQLHNELDQLFRQRLVNNVIKSSRLFQELEEDKQQALMEAFELQQVSPGSKVIHEGEAPSGLYILLHGAAEVWATAEDDSKVRVATLTEGDTFGEFSLLTGDPTTAEVLLPEGGTLFHLPAQSYNDLLGHIPQLGEKLDNLMETRREILNDMVAPVEADFEELDEAWLVEEFEE